MRKSLLAIVVVGLLAALGAAAALFFAARFVTPPSVPLPAEGGAQIPAGQTVSLAAGEQATLPDGLVVRLEGVDDSRCKPDVVCVWAGELAARLSLSGGALPPGGSQELVLGERTRREAVVAPYAFSLLHISESAAIVAVSKE